MIGFDSFPGLGVALGAFLVFMAGGLGALLSLFVALASSVSQPDTRGRRVLRYLAGPTTCIVVGVLYFIGAWIGGAVGAIAFFDALGWFCPVVGVVAGITVQALVARAHERRINAWLTEGKEIEPP